MLQQPEFRPEPQDWSAAPEDANFSPRINSSSLYESPEVLDEVARQIGMRVDFLSQSVPSLDGKNVSQWTFDHCMEKYFLQEDLLTQGRDDFLVPMDGRFMHVVYADGEAVGSAVTQITSLDAGGVRFCEISANEAHSREIHAIIDGLNAECSELRLIEAPTRGTRAVWAVSESGQDMIVVCLASHVYAALREGKVYDVEGFLAALRQEKVITGIR